MTTLPASLSASTLSPTTGRLSRRYLLHEVIHRGANTVLYRGEMQAAGQFARPVVLKMLKADLVGSREAEARLRDEARLLGLVRHRAIVGVHGVVTLAGRLGLVMELVAGEDVLTLLRQGPVPVSAALEIVEEVAGALDVAWRSPGDDGAPLRLAHRCLDGRAVRVTPEGAVKVVGFDFARADLRAREAGTRAISRSFPFAVDDLDGDAADRRDVGALGALLYSMVHGSPLPPLPAAGRTPAVARALEALCIAEPARSEVQALLGLMLSADAGDRPTLRDVQRRAGDLRRRLGGQSLSAWAAGATRRAPARLMLGATDPLSGGVFVEGSEAPPAPARLEVPWATLGVLAAGTTALSFGLLLMLLPLIWTTGIAPLLARLSG